MTESYDYDPVDWKGHDFKAARAAYDRHVGSSYKDATAKGVDPDSLIETTITSTALRPLVVVVDQTGSMGDWPATMFSKLPYLDHEAKYYLGDDAEVCFAAIGDAHHNERYPLQVRPFAQGKPLAAYLKELVIEGGGGGSVHETYELAALYLARNMQVDPMAEPIVIFIGDEHYYDTISIDHAERYCKVKLERSMRASEAFGELSRKAAVYFIQKPYGHSYDSGRNEMSGETKAVHEKWARLLGGDHIAILPDPGRVVDVIFGILAAEVDRVDDFREEIEGRQTKAQVDVVYKSLKTVHQVAPGTRKALRSGNSVMLRDTGGDASTSLLDS